MSNEHTVFCEITGTHVKTTTRDGEVKSVSLPDFSLALSQSLLSQPHENASELVEYPLGMFAYTHNVVKQVFAVYYPERKVDVRFMGPEGESVYPIVMPNVIILSTLHKGRNSMWEWNRSRGLKFLMTDLDIQSLPISTQANDLMRTRRVSALAMPNMYEGGAMCLGDNSLPASFPPKQYRGLRSAYELLLNSPFNSDLPVPGGGRRRPREWLEHLSGHREDHGTFPYREVFLQVYGDRNID